MSWQCIIDRRATLIPSVSKWSSRLVTTFFSKSTNERHNEIWNERKDKSEIWGVVWNYQSYGGSGLWVSIAAQFVNVHMEFHVSLLRKYVPDLSHVLFPYSFEVGPDLVCEATPIKFVDRKVKKLRNKEVSSVKVIWSHHSIEKATWEAEKDMRERYPYLVEAFDT